MQDFTRYNYTIKEKDIMRILRMAVTAGCQPLIIINGEYYDVEIEKGDSDESATKDLPF